MTATEQLTRAMERYFSERLGKSVGIRADNGGWKVNVGAETLAEQTGTIKELFEQLSAIKP
jgi:hypothetical protein